MTKQLGFFISLSLSLFTIAAFVIAVLTPPLSGPYCIGNCFTYPFTNIAERFPRDYYWMYPTMALNLLYFAWVLALHYSAPKKLKYFSHLAVAFALVSAALHFTDYFVQVTVIQPSLLNGELEGIAMLSQFNAHGIFIVLEEAGFILMSLSFVCLSFIFSGSRVSTILKWVFIANFLLSLIAFIGYSLSYGIFREYRFEVAAFSINWLTLIVGGFLSSSYFKTLKM